MGGQQQLTMRQRLALLCLVAALAAGGARAQAPRNQEEPAAGDQADRIGWALARYLAAGRQRDQAEPARHQQHQEEGADEWAGARVQARAAPGAAGGQQQAIIDRWLESALDERAKAAPATGRAYGQPAARQDQEQPALAALMAASSGHKSTRNIQPVYMRLPPRFGKRTY